MLIFADTTFHTRSHVLSIVPDARVISRDSTHTLTYKVLQMSMFSYIEILERRFVLAEVFHLVIGRVLASLPIARCYIDNAIIFKGSPHQHVRHLQTIFKRLREWGLRLHHSKCKFFHNRLPYLGHMIVPRGLGVQQAKIDALQQIRTPIDVPRLRAFFGLINYYRRFVKNFSLIAKPLTFLTGKDQLWT